MKRLLVYSKDYWGQIAIAAISSVTASIATVFIPKIYGNDSIELDIKRSKVKLICVWDFGNISNVFDLFVFTANVENDAT